MAQFKRTFTNDKLFAQPSDFTVKILRSGDTATVSEDVTSGRFLNIFKAGTTGTFTVAWNVLNGAQDVEQLIRFRTGGANPASGRYGILYNRYDGSTEATTRGFAASFTPVSNVPSVIVFEDSFGTINFSNYPWVNNQMYWARFRTWGNQQFFKIWVDGEREPVDWLFSSTYTGPTIASPYSGLGSYMQWANIQVFYLSAGTNGDTAPFEFDAQPAPAITGTKVKQWDGTKWVYVNSKVRTSTEWRNTKPNIL